MVFLRTISTPRLLLSIVAAVVACLACTAIAIAASSGGPVPPRASLADAIHGALTGAPVNSVSADIIFTNNLFSGSSIETNDPLITGTAGRLWATDGHLRIELQSDNGDAEIVVSHRDFWAYDPASNTVYKGTFPQPTAIPRPTQAVPPSTGTGMASQSPITPAPVMIGHPNATPGMPPSVAQIQDALNHLSTHINISGAKATDVGGQPAYSVTLSPKSTNGLLGAVHVAFDANHAVPLDFALIPRGTSTPALELSASSVSYGPIPALVFKLSPPAGAHIVQISPPPGVSSGGSTNPSGPRTVQMVGHGLGSVIVAKGAAHGAASGGSGPAGPLPLQRVNVNGATGHQLATSLGTVLQFTRDGTNYLLAGSVTPATLVAVARGL